MRQGLLRTCNRVSAKCQRWPWRTLAFAWLILATVVGATSSFRGLVPIDARTGQTVEGLEATFEYPGIGAAIEPLMALAHVILGAPDFRIAVISIAAWLFVITGAATFWMSGRRNTIRACSSRVLESVYKAVASVSLLALYMLFVCMISLPGLSLVVKDPAAIVADLHSHTFLSSDGIASLRQNLAYHRDRGYTVVAITDHYSDIWRPTAIGPSETPTPEIIQGIELRFWNSALRRGYLLALGVRQDVPFPYRNYDLLSDQAIRQFIDYVKNVQRGAIVTLYHGLIAEDIERLAADGVDGFEIANFGHPELTEGTRAALLEVQRSHRTVLLANSDWHGWSGFSRTWTVVKPTNVAGSRAEQVINALRDRDPERIIPIVSQIMFTPSVFRGIFAPVAEIIRYGTELSPTRLVSWWVWTIILVWLATRLQRANVSPGRCLLGGSLLVLGGPLSFRGVELAIAWYSGTPHIFPLVVAAASGSAGFFALAIAAVIGRDVIRSRGGQGT